MAMIFG